MIRASVTSSRLTSAVALVVVMPGTLLAGLPGRGVLLHAHDRHPTHVHAILESAAWEPWHGAQHHDHDEPGDGQDRRDGALFDLLGGGRQRELRIVVDDHPALRCRPGLVLRDCPVIQALVVAVFPSGDPIAPAWCGAAKSPGVLRAPSMIEAILLRSHALLL